MQRTGERGANALKQELVVHVEATSGASAEHVYAVLADLSTHTVWAGERQGTKTRLLTIDAPAGPATVGTEFSSTGSDPMGSFATAPWSRRPSRGRRSSSSRRPDSRRGRGDERLDECRALRAEPLADGCRIVCTGRVARMSSLPGSLKVFNVPGLRGLALKASARVSRRTVRNLARYAEER